MNKFGLYSQYYDLLYKEKDYASEVEYVYNIIHEYKPNATTILDLGCGTGMHAISLAFKGFSVTGVDISQTMLEGALVRKKSLDETHSNRLSFYHGDVRTFRSDMKFDVVISLFHVFSYQTTNADLEAAFETAASHLNPGGILIFDYWFGPAVLTQRPEVRVKRLANNKCEVLRIAEPTLDERKNTVDVNYFLLIDSLHEKKSERIIEKHQMRYLFLPEIEMLSEKYFQVIKHMEWMSDTSPSSRSWAGVSILGRKS
jgi:SAM-dependent methyltransferase